MSTRMKPAAQLQTFLATLVEVFCPHHENQIARRSIISSPSKSTTAILGGIVGGMIALFILFSVLMVVKTTYYERKRRRYGNPAPAAHGLEYHDIEGQMDTMRVPEGLAPPPPMYMESNAGSRSFLPTGRTSEDYYAIINSPGSSRRSSDSSIVSAPPIAHLNGALPIKSPPAYSVDMPSYPPSIAPKDETNSAVSSPRMR